MTMTIVNLFQRKKSLENSFFIYVFVFHFRIARSYGLITSKHKLIGIKRLLKFHYLVTILLILHKFRTLMEIILFRFLWF